eukprot:scaffold107944_cov18-Tisochrysis_lutea.AAC.1
MCVYTCGVCVCVCVCVCVSTHPVWHLLGLLANLACLATDETLDGEEGVLWVHHGLALGDLQAGRIPTIRVSATPAWLHSTTLETRGSPRHTLHIAQTQPTACTCSGCAVWGMQQEFVVATECVHACFHHCCALFPQQALLHTCPTRRSPPLVKATTEGVVRLPSALAMIVGLPPSIAATAELVVPKSMPTTCVYVYRGSSIVCDGAVERVHWGRVVGLRGLGAPTCCSKETHTDTGEAAGHKQQEHTQIHIHTRLLAQQAAS